MSCLTDDELERYSRQIMLSDIGVTGQQKLKEARVLLIGAGGLGSPAALYLCAAGIGHLTIIEPDLVSLSNLQRQILYGDNDLGKSKAELAHQRLLALNPHVAIEVINQYFSPENGVELARAHDVVLDCTDNFKARYLANDSCMTAGRPLIHGSIRDFQGSLAVFSPGGPCYRCLFPYPDDSTIAAWSVPRGVMGVLPGIIGTLQATEALKMILGVGRSLEGRIVYYNMLELSTKEFEIRRDPKCTCCGDAEC